jgi:hypothetical protein
MRLKDSFKYIALHAFNFTFCFCISISLTVVGQSPRQVDSLLKPIDRENVDSNKLKLYHRIGNYYMDNNAGKAIEYFEKAQEIEKELNRPVTVYRNGKLP